MAGDGGGAPSQPRIEDMSLKYIHLVFISAAIVVTVIFALWALQTSVALAAVAFAVSVLETEYARRFLRKARTL
jgi:Flp pilus assembly protein TadB